MGVELDQRLTYTAHVSKVTKAAADTARAISRILPNIGGPSISKRLLLTSVVQSKFMYAAGIWAPQAIKTAKNRNAIAKAQRVSALRVIRAYRTVSDAAAQMLAKQPPGELIIRERLAINPRKTAVDRTEDDMSIKTEERHKTIIAWQSRRDQESKASWTRKLLPDLSRWYDAKVVPTYHLTQALTGHGSFRKCR